MVAIGYGEVKTTYDEFEGTSASSNNTKRDIDTITVCLESLDKAITSLSMKIYQIVNEKLKIIRPTGVEAKEPARDPITKVDEIIEYINSLIMRINYLTKEEIELIYNEICKL